MQSFRECKSICIKFRFKMKNIINKVNIGFRLILHTHKAIEKNTDGHKMAKDKLAKILAPPNAINNQHYSH